MVLSETRGLSLFLEKASFWKHAITFPDAGAASFRLRRWPENTLNVSAVSRLGSEGWHLHYDPTRSEERRLASWDGCGVRFELTASAEPVSLRPLAAI